MSNGPTPFTIGAGSSGDSGAASAVAMVVDPPASSSDSALNDFSRTLRDIAENSGSNFVPDQASIINAAVPIPPPSFGAQSAKEALAGGCVSHSIRPMKTSRRFAVCWTSNLQKCMLRKSKLP